MYLKREYIEPAKNHILSTQRHHVHRINLLFRLHHPVVVKVNSIRDTRQTIVTTAYRPTVCTVLTYWTYSKAETDCGHGEVQQSFDEALTLFSSLWVEVEPLSRSFYRIVLICEELTNSS